MLVVRIARRSLLIITFAIACLLLLLPRSGSAQFRYVPPAVTPIASAFSATTAFNAVSAAATDTTFLGIFEGLTVGPYFTIGVSRMNENIEHGWYSSPATAYTIGGAVSLSVNDWIGLNLGIAYDSRDLFLAARMADNTADSVSIDMGIGYVDIQPSIRIFWFLFGLSIDIPMSANATENILHFGPSGTEYAVNRNPDVKDIASQTELRGGLSIPVFHSDAGILNLMITGSYPLGKVLAGTSTYDSTGGYFSGIGKGPLPTVQGGVSYQFDLLH